MFDKEHRATTCEKWHNILRGAQFLLNLLEKLLQLV